MYSIGHCLFGYKGIESASYKKKAADRIENRIVSGKN